MPFEKGKSGNPAGKPKGALSHRTIAAKEAVDEVFQNIGGVPNFTRWAQDNQNDFYKMFAKSIPIDVSMKSDNTIRVIYVDPTKRDKPDV